MAKVPKRIAELWTDAELQAYSKEHLKYEIQMFSLCGELLSNPLSQLTVTPFMRNVVIEAFGIHLRGLLEFFRRLKSEKEDDVLAVDFMNERNWHQPTLSAVADAAWTRVNKEVGHLTTVRKNRVDPSKDWTQIIVALLPEIMGMCDQFVRLADSNKLSQEVRDLVSANREQSSASS